MTERWATDRLGSLAPSYHWLKSVELTDQLLDRVHGTVIGSAVGDALGAPFEFGEPGQYSNRYPTDSTENEMQGGGPWDPGEFTDDTQMAILEAESFITSGGIDEPHLFDAFRRWVNSDPKDVGVSTRTVLTDPAGWPTAPQQYFEANPNSSAGNGSIMRASFMAAYWGLAANLSGTAEIARRLSAVTHADPAAGEGRALLHMLIAGELLNKGFAIGQPTGFAHELGFLDHQHRDRFAAAVEPNATYQISNDPVSNGTAWGVIRDAATAVHRGHDFATTMCIACDVGGDVDTVAAVAGAWAGARYGLSDIPDRWVNAIHGNVLDRTYNTNSLIQLMDRVLAVRPGPRG